MKYNYLKHILLGIFFCLPLLLVAQEEITVSGTVTSVEGEPLIGANVTIVATNEGTVTDFNGEYSLDVSSDASLEFTYVGHQSKTVDVDGRTTIDITLKEGKSLGEVVVTAFGMSKEKKKLGYSVDEVSSEELEGTGQTNVVSSLQGRSPGLQVMSSSGAPGAGVNFLIRGITSLNPNRSNRPLVVIDGIEVSDNPIVTSTTPEGVGYGLATGNSTQTSVSNRLIDLNPDDIASMSVLKGAAATALYGVRASNGAIIITTKKGKSGEPEINLNYGMGWSEVNKYPEVQTGYIDGHRSGSAKRSFLWDSWGVKVHDQTTSTPSNIYKDFYETGNNYNLGASVTAGNDRFKYRLSASHYNETGIVPESYFEKTNFSLNTEYSISDRLDVSGQLLYTNSGGNTPHEGRKSIMNVLAYMAVTADAKEYHTPYTYGGNFAVGIIDHPQFLAEEVKNLNNVNRLLGSTKLNYRILDGLNLNYTVGLDYFNDERMRRVHPETDEGQSAVNGPPYGFLVESTINNRVLTSNLSLNFNRQLSDNFSLGATVGQYLYTRSNNVLSVVGKQFEVDNFYNLNSVNQLEQSNMKQRYVNPAVYGEATLGFRDYMYLSVTGRNDWSSTLPERNRSYFFPSVSLSWIASESIAMPDAVNFLKLRGSYAVTGKDARPYVVGRYYSRTPQFPFGDVIGYQGDVSIGDENLRPEFSRTLEFGLESRFFRNRLGLDVSYYTGRLDDMILPVPVSNSSGIASYTTNAGSMTNYGVETTVFGDIIRNSDGFNWTSSINWGMNRAYVEEISTGGDENEIVLTTLRNVQYKYVEGGRIGDLYGRPFERTESGELILDDEGLPTLNQDEYVKMGNGFPDFTAGFRNQFSYKGVSLSFLLEWRKGGHTIDIMRPYSIDNGQLDETLGRYQSVVFDGVQKVGEDDNGNPIYEENTQETEITPAGYYRNSNRRRYAPEALLQPSDWLRLRNLSVSYSLPMNKVNIQGISEIKISFIGNNLFLDTPYNGWDPESNFFGASSNIYGFTGFRTPNTRSYQFRINLTL